jgi:hypothetical protein
VRAAEEPSPSHAAHGSPIWWRGGTRCYRMTMLGESGDDLRIVDRLKHAIDEPVLADPSGGK